MKRGSVAAGMLLGLVLGLLDALVLQVNFLQTRHGLPQVPLSVWALAPLVWIPLTAALTPIVRRLPIAFAVAGGLLVLFRWSVPLRRIVLADGRIPKLFPYAGDLLVLLAGGLLLLPLIWLVHRHAARLQELAYRLRFVLAALTILAIAGVIASRWPASVQRPRRAARSDSASIVLIFLDTMRYDASPLRDPQSHLSRLARSGVSYTNAMAPAPWTLPSHFGVITGLGATRLPMDYERNLYLGTAPTMAETLSAAGYATAAIVANRVLAAETGFDRGYQRFEFSRNEHDLCRTTPFEVLSRFADLPGCAGPGWTAPEVTRRAAALIERMEGPYFLTLNYMDPHLPYYVPRECRGEGFRGFDEVRDAQLLYRVNRTGQPIPAKRLAAIRNVYLATSSCVDRALGDLFAAIRRSPQGGRTIVVVVGDHGEQFGEHGISLHGNSVYRQVLHVPMVVAGAGVTPRAPVAEPIDISTLHGILMQLAGRTNAAPPGGPVFSRYQPQADASHLPRRFHRGAWSVFADGHHLIAWDDGDAELYALSDTAEVRDLAAVNTAVREKLLSYVRYAKEERARHTTGSEILRSLPYMQ
jgi:arylsulfatase A-like enzyme